MKPIKYSLVLSSCLHWKTCHVVNPSLILHDGTLYLDHSQVPTLNLIHIIPFSFCVKHTFFCYVAVCILQSCPLLCIRFVCPFWISFPNFDNHFFSNSFRLPFSSLLLSPVFAQSSCTYISRLLLVNYNLYLWWICMFYTSVQEGCKLDFAHAAG